jgi:hypothetical protein
MEIMRSVARSAGFGNSCALYPGLTPRAVCCRALRALSELLDFLGKPSQLIHPAAANEWKISNNSPGFQDLNFSPCFEVVILHIAECNRLVQGGGKS